MKTLNLNQMENLEAGEMPWDCTLALGSLVFGTAAVLAGGPLTWWGVGGVFVLWGNSVETCTD